MAQARLSRRGLSGAAVPPRITADPSTPRCRYARASARSSRPRLRSPRCWRSPRWRGCCRPHGGLYTPDPATLPTFLGQDGITLVVILPLLLWSVWATRRGSLRGLLLWTAALFYLAYSYAYYVSSPEFNVLYLAYIAIVAMSLYGCLYLLISMDAEAVAACFSARTPVRVASAFLMTLSLGLGVAWVAMIVSYLTSGAIPSRVNLVVWPMDLVVAFPAMVLGRIVALAAEAARLHGGDCAAHQGRPAGCDAGGQHLVGQHLLGVAPDPAVPVYAIGGLGGVALAAHYLRSLDRPHPPDAVCGGRHRRR